MEERPDTDTEEGRRRSGLKAARSAYLDALLTGDQVLAETVVRDVIDMGIEQSVIDDEVIAPALHAVGELWANGEITVADEHLATEISIRVLALQREAFRVARRRGRQRVMLAAVEGERHVVGLEMAANLLVTAGYDVRYLGADVLTDALAPAVVRHRPAVFGLSATMPLSAQALELAIDEVRSALPDIAILVGGRAVPSRIRPSPWLAVARSAVDVVDSVDSLIHRPELN